MNKRTKEQPSNPRSSQVAGRPIKFMFIVTCGKHFAMKRVWAHDFIEAVEMWSKDPSVTWASEEALANLARLKIDKSFADDSNVEPGLFMFNCSLGYGTCPPEFEGRMPCVWAIEMRDDPGWRPRGMDKIIFDALTKANRRKRAAAVAAE